MPYYAPPAKNEISATPSQSNATAKAGFGKLWDYVTALLGGTGNPEDALAGLKLEDSRALYNLAPTFSVAGNALTITLKDKVGGDLAPANPGYLAQRSAVIGNASHNLRKLTANLSLVVSSGSTLGHTTAVLCPIYIYLLDNAGAQELAVSGTFRGESGLFSTTAEGGVGGADDQNVLYSQNARADLPGRLVAIAWSNQAAAGAWTAVPTEVKLPPFHVERVGEIVDYGGGAVPYGFFLMDGSNQSRATYAKLFGRIGTNFGVGDGATTFGIGDSRRRTLVGSGGTGTGTLGNAVGNSGGTETHTLIAAEIPTITTPIGVIGNFAPPGGATQPLVTNGASTNSNNTGGGAHPNLQPSLVVTKMIRWLGDI